MSIAIYFCFAGVLLSLIGLCDKTKPIMLKFLDFNLFASCSTFIVLLGISISKNWRNNK